MTRIVYLSVVIFVAVVAARWWSEHRLIGSFGVHGNLSARDCEQLDAQTFYFVDRRLVAAECEHAIVNHIERLAAACDFSSIASLVAKVLAPPDSGAEPRARRLAMDLSTHHVACVRQLAEQSGTDPTRVLRELNLVQRTYDDPVVRTETGNIRGEYLLREARRHAAAGDAVAALECVAQIGGDQPLRVQNDADDLAVQALSVVAASRREARDFAGLYRLFGDAIGAAAPRAALQQRLAALKESQADVPLFGRPLRNVAAAPDITSIGSAAGPGLARLLIDNPNDFPIHLIFKGGVDVERDVPGRDKLTLEMAAGEYVQLIRATDDSAVLFGTLRIGTQSYLQQVSGDRFHSASGTES